MNPPAIRHYQPHEITDEILRALICAGLYDSQYVDRSYSDDHGGLYGLYMNHDEEHPLIEHLWVAGNPAWPVGVATFTVHQKNDERILYLFVAPRYRKQGIGQILLDHAIAARLPFGGLGTDLSHRLYHRNGVPDLRIEAPKIVSHREITHAKIPRPNCHSDPI